MTDNVVNFPVEKAIRRSNEPLSYDSDGKPMRLFAYQYRHADRTWSVSLWAYTWEDAEARIASIATGLTLEGQIVEIGEGEFLL